MTLYEFNENHNDLQMYDKLSQFILKNKEKIIPNTFTDEEFDDFIYNKFY
jgi:nitrogenase subunit NifH